jgi:hypothetical protein
MGGWPSQIEGHPALGHSSGGLGHELQGPCEVGFEVPAVDYGVEHAVF